MTYVLSGIFSVLDALDGVRREKFFLFFLTVDAAKKSFDLDFTRKLHNAINHGFGARGATGHKHVDGHNVLYAFGDMIAAAERTA